MMLKLKLQYFGHLMQRVDSLQKTLMLGGIGGRRRRGRQDEMAGWHHWLDGCESEWTPGVGDGQGGLACCDSWGRGESDTTELLNWTELNWVPKSCLTLFDSMDRIPPGSSVLPFFCPKSLPSIRVFSNESTLRMRWPKYWGFSFSIIPSKEHPGLISFRMDWLDLLAVQGTLKSLLQHHSSKASIVPHSAFFT